MPYRSTALSGGGDLYRALPYGSDSIKLVAVDRCRGRSSGPGYEANLLYLACLAALVLVFGTPGARRLVRSEGGQTLERGGLGCWRRKTSRVTSAQAADGQ